MPRSALHQENWVCRRCQVCAVCGAAPPDDVLQRCHQCNQTYHLSCLGPHACSPPGRPDQPWVSTPNHASSRAQTAGACNVLAR